MGPADIMAWAERLGLRVWSEGEKLKFAPLDAVPTEYVDVLREHKASLLAYLTQPEPTPREVVDSLEVSMALGQRLARGEIAALRCGITGRECRACHGIPCLGSEPWGR